MDRIKASEFTNLKNEAQSDINNMTMLQILDMYYESKKNMLKSLHTITTLKNYINALESQFSVTLYPYMINEEFMNHFYRYVYDVMAVSMNSAITAAEQLKAILTWAKKYHHLDIDDTYTYSKSPKFIKEQVTLSSDSLYKLYYFPMHLAKGVLQYEALKKLIIARDMFVLQCNLGLRYSDFIRLSPVHFNNDVILMTSQKYGNPIKIDIDKVAVNPDITKEILKRYGYTIPYRWSVDNFNKKLKNIFLICGITLPIKQKIMVGNEIIELDSQLENVITSHTARRTFCTINFSRNIPDEILLEATGHQNYDDYLKYVRNNTMYDLHFESLAKLKTNEYFKDPEYKSSYNERKRRYNKYWKDKNVEQIYLPER